MSHTLSSSDIQTLEKESEANLLSNPNLWESERGVEGVWKTMLRAISTGTAETISPFDLLSHDHVVPTNSDVSVQQPSGVIGYSASAWDIGDDVGIQISLTREFQAVCEIGWQVRVVLNWNAGQNVVPPKWSSFASNIENRVLDLLVEHGKYDVASRISDLIQMIGEDPDDDETLLPESLRSIAKFFIKYDPPYSTYGSVVAGHDGVLGVEWKLPMSQPPDSQWKNCDGILSMRFLPSDKITYAGETRQDDDGNAFYDMGEDSHSVVSKRVAPFLARLRIADANQRI